MRYWISSTTSPGTRSTPSFCPPTSSATWKKSAIYIAFLHHGSLILCEEKDRLLEDYALLKLPLAGFDAVPPEAVHGKKVTPYGVEALVRRSAVSPAFRLEHTTLEDIILFLAREEM